MAYLKKKRKPLRKRVYKKKAAKKVGPLKQMVRAEIARNVETKSTQHMVQDRLIYSVTNASFPVSNVFHLGPNSNYLTVTQGTSVSQRIGNKIKTKSLMFKGTLFCRQYVATLNPIPQPLQVKMFIFYERGAVVNNVPNPVSDFFQNGSGVYPLQDDLSSMWMPVNSEKYRVLTTRTYKLGPASNTGTGSSQDLQYFSNNDFKLNVNFSINLSKYVPQHVLYVDSDDNPRSRNLYCMIVPVAACGLALTSSVGPMLASYMLDYRYEDA